MTVRFCQENIDLVRCVNDDHLGAFALLGRDRRILDSLVRLLKLVDRREIKRTPTFQGLRKDTCRLVNDRRLIIGMIPRSAAFRIFRLGQTCHDAVRDLLGSV